MSCEFGRILVYGEFRFSYSGRGRPRKHGDSFQLTNPENWTSPDSALDLDTSSHRPYQSQNVERFTLFWHLRLIRSI